jgi:hypothetical protein
MSLWAIPYIFWIWLCHAIKIPFTRTKHWKCTVENENLFFDSSVKEMLRHIRNVTRPNQPVDITMRPHWTTEGEVWTFTYNAVKVKLILY